MRQTQAAQKLGKIELMVNLHFKDCVRIAETSGIEKAVCIAYLRQLRSPALPRALRANIPFSRRPQAACPTSCPLPFSLPESGSCFKVCQPQNGVP